MSNEDDQEVHSRIRSLERWRNSQETRIAVEKEQKSHLDERFDKLEKEVLSGFNEIKGAFWKVFWAITIIMIAAFANWVIKGGLGG